MMNEETPRISTTLQHTGRQYRTTIPLQIAQFLEIHEGDYFQWALDITSDMVRKRVKVKLLRIGQDEGKKNRMKTRVQNDGKQYRITVPASIVQMLGVRKGYNMYWSFFTTDEDMLNIMFSRPQVEFDE